MHIKHLPVIGSFIKLLDMKISEHGLQIGLLQLLKRSATTFQIQGITKETEEILRTKPVVIVAHHPFDAEVLCVLAALPPQENTYLVINNSYVGIVPSADKHLIPVYISHHRNGLDKRIFLEKFLLKFLPSKFFSEEMEHEKNKESIKFASQKLSENGTVVIFPNRRSPNGKWYNGVGYMITGVIKEQEVYVIPVVVHGTSFKNSTWWRKITQATQCLFWETHIIQTNS